MIRRYRKLWEYLLKEAQSILSISTPWEVAFEQSPEGRRVVSELKGGMVGGQKVKVIYPSL